MTIDFENAEAMAESVITMATLRDGYWDGIDVPAIGSIIEGKTDFEWVACKVLAHGKIPGDVVIFSQALHQETVFMSPMKSEPINIRPIKMRTLN